MGMEMGERGGMGAVANGTCVGEMDGARNTPWTKEITAPPPPAQLPATNVPRGAGARSG